jgi:hypothetical protein
MVVRRPLTVIAIAAFALTALGSLARADSVKVLTRIKGTVAIHRNGTTGFKPVAGSLGVRDESIARTGKKSAATIALADSSEIDLGETTQVRVGSFDRDAEVAGHTIGIDGGALKFTIRHPADGRANYRFVTPTAQIAVRGTSGILIVTPSKTTLICLDCGSDDLVATHDGTDESLATGEVMQIVGLPGSQSVVKLPLKGFVDPALVQFLGDTYARAMAKAMPAIEAAMKPRATPNPCASGASNRISSETASETFDTVSSKTNCK